MLLARTPLPRPRGPLSRALSSAVHSLHCHSRRFLSSMPAGSGLSPTAAGDDRLPTLLPSTYALRFVFQKTYQMHRVPMEDAVRGRLGVKRALPILQACIESGLVYEAARVFAALRRQRDLTAIDIGILKRLVWFFLRGKTPDHACDVLAGIRESLVESDVQNPAPVRSGLLDCYITIISFYRNAGEYAAALDLAENMTLDQLLPANSNLPAFMRGLQAAVQAHAPQLLEQHPQRWMTFRTFYKTSEPEASDGTG